MRANGVAIDAQGRTVIVGEANNTFALARFTPGGTLDPSFGSAGKVATAVSREGEAAANAVAIDARGRLVVAGETCCSPRTLDFAIARYNPDGSLDRTFGRGGRVTTGFEGRDGASANAIAIDTQGRVLAAGTDGENFALARYRTDGSLDTSFGDRGRVVTPIGSGRASASGISVEPGGRIVVGGASAYARGIALAAYMPDGTLDPGFGVAGKVVTTFSSAGGSEARGLAADAAGRIIVVGSDLGGPGPFPDADFALARFEPNGARDTTFGHDGEVLTDFNPGNGTYASDDEALAVTVTTTGEIVAAGSAFNCPTSPCHFDTRFAIARYQPDGTLDPAFGSNGKVTTDFAARPDSDAGAVAVDATGDVAAAGALSYDQGLAVARYTPIGAPDPLFGKNGTASIRFHARTWITTANVNRRIGKATFAYGISGGYAAVQCRLLAAHRAPRFKVCPSDADTGKQTYAHLRPGRYRFQVRALRAHGADNHPAQWRFRIKR